MDPSRNSSAMFGKVFEPIRSSERTKNLRSKIMYKTRKNTRNVTFNQNKKNLIKTNSYNLLYDLYNGFIECTKEDAANIDNSGCFHIWKDDNVDRMHNTTINHWFLSTIDYFDLNPADKYILTSDEWPYKAGVLKEFFNDNFRYFNNANIKNYRVYADDFKRGANMTKYF